MLRGGGSEGFRAGEGEREGLREGGIIVGTEEGGGGLEGF